MKSQNIIKPLVLGSAIVGLLLTVTLAQQDYLWTDNCAAAVHNPDTCQHRWPANNSMCWTDGGKGVHQCEGTDTPSICVSTNITYYQVYSDFPQDPLQNSWSTCIFNNGSYSVSAWTSHSSIESPPAHCYQTVRCTWSDQSHCTVAPGSGGGWVDLPKKTSVPCGGLVKLP